jgi:hypothetical protein
VLKRKWHAKPKRPPDFKLRLKPLDFKPKKLPVKSRRLPDIKPKRLLVKPKILPR